MQHDKNRIRLKKKRTIRKKLSGTGQRPRVSVYKSLKYIYVQAIDDVKGVTLCSHSTCVKDFKQKHPEAAINVETAKILGNEFGQKLKEKGLESVVFDRNGYKYHGRVKSLADGIRESGINF